MPSPQLWRSAALRVHAAVSTALLAVLFYGVVSPAGLLRRIFGGDPLRLRRSSEASYWVQRDPKPQGNLRDQF